MSLKTWDTIGIRALLEPKSEGIYFEAKKLYSFENDIITEPVGAILNFKLMTSIDIYERYPDDFVIWLSRFGGILALLKIGSLLLFFHRMYHR